MSQTILTQKRKLNAMQKRGEQSQHNRSYHNDMGFMFVAQTRTSISDFARDHLELNREQKRELQ